MSLSAREFETLESEARAMAAVGCRSSLSDALRCLHDTGDPIAPLELLHAMSRSGHGARNNPSAAIDRVGQWLDRRLGRKPDIALERLALELGWLCRLVTIHGDRNGGGQRDSSRNPPRHPPRRADPVFGRSIKQLRARRERALTRADARERAGDRPDASHAADESRTVRPDRLPDTLEVYLASIDDARRAWKTARTRRKKGRPAKDALLDIRPVSGDLLPLAADLACSLLHTDGMNELQKRTVAGGGTPPSFFVAIADLAERDGKRVAARIAFDPPRT